MRSIYSTACALALHIFCSAASGAFSDIYVDPRRGSDNHAGTPGHPVRSVYAAQRLVRDILKKDLRADVTVQLSPGLHRVDTPLDLGVLDSGQGVVTWRSLEAEKPATLGAPIAVTGWSPAGESWPAGALAAPLPQNIPLTASLRHLWVNEVRAERPRLYLDVENISSVGNSSSLPWGGYDFGRSHVNPALWKNPKDVEFVYTGVRSGYAIDAFVEPRCTVDHVEGHLVALKGGGWKGCYNKLFYWGDWKRGRWPAKPPPPPPYVENVHVNFTFAGQWYYDRANSTIIYLPRPGEIMTSAMVTVSEVLLTMNHARNVRWEGVGFEFATWSGASGVQGFVDTQAAYLYQQGEPPANVRVEASHNVTFFGCSFAHLGAVYAFSATGGSQYVTVANCTFTDISGGGIKLGNVGERGAPAPSSQTDPAMQDANLMISDNWLYELPTEYHGAVPVQLGYVAHTAVQYNTISGSSYSGIHAGWGWGLHSFARNMSIRHNKVQDVMRLLPDGGAIYTCIYAPGSSVTGNYLLGDPHQYGVLYHDGGSGGWTDERNVISHAKASCVFTHGSSPNTTVDFLWCNDTQRPNFEGATKRSNIFMLGKGEEWPAEAAKVIARAGRRTSRRARRPHVKWSEDGVLHV